MALSTEELAQQKTITEFFLNLNYISLAFAIVLAIFISSTTWIGKFKATRRLSYRLYFWLAIADILTHAPLLVDYKDSKISCQIVNFIIFFANVWTVLTTTVMALNLHLVFILAKPKLVRSERFYVISCFLLALFLCIPIAVLNGIFPQSCPFYLQFSAPFDVLALYGFFGLWILLPTLYCFYVFIIIAVKLSVSKSPSLNHMNSTEDQRAQNMLLKRMVARLVLYPLVPVITVFPYLISVSSQDLERNYRIFDAVLQYFAATTQGTLNFLFFMFDPALPALFKEIKGVFGSSSTPSIKVGVKQDSYKLNETNLQNKAGHIRPFQADLGTAHPSQLGSVVSLSHSHITVNNEDIELIGSTNTQAHNIELTTNPRLLV